MREYPLQTVNLAPRTSNISNFPLKIVRGTGFRKHFVNRSKLKNFEMVEFSLDILEEMILMNNIEIENMDLSNNGINEVLSKVGSSNDGTSNHALYDRVYCTLRDGITIGDNVAKCAARMGQCFSSTRAIQKLPIDDIKEMPDIVRNGFTFSDGIYELGSEHAALDFLQRNVDEYGISISLADLVKAGFLRNNDRAFLLGVLVVAEILLENQIYCYLDGDDFTFPKTGTPLEFLPVLRASKFSHFMEKLIDNLTNLKQVLEFLDDARKLRRKYNVNIRRSMNQFGIMTEIEVTNGYIMNTITKILKLKKMTQPERLKKDTKLLESKKREIDQLKMEIKEINEITAETIRTHQ
ncbi:hypothetical protein C1646_752412 [Rhizophagus diaphanus]|nr:hypothetical protein C1646_752412 [Rhizophagus diaphanus] [Rhizophagus sp. MUCL 43196]